MSSWRATALPLTTSSTGTLPRVADAGPLDVPVGFLVERLVADVVAGLVGQQGRGADANLQRLAALGGHDAGPAALPVLADAQAVDREVEQVTQPVAAVAAAVAQSEDPAVVVERLVLGRA